MIKQGGYLLSGEVDQKCADMLMNKLKEQRSLLKAQERELQAKHHKLEQQLRAALSMSEGPAVMDPAIVFAAVSELREERNQLCEQMQALAEYGAAVDRELIKALSVLL